VVIHATKGTCHDPSNRLPRIRRQLRRRDALDYASVEEAEKVFNTLASGGQVTMPMQPAFWAKRFGMLIDKFGTPWIVNGEPTPV
jgi:hypothetical protein